MTDRKGIVKLAIEMFLSGKLPFSVKVNDLDRDKEKISLGLLKSGFSKKIGMSTEKDKGLVWFRKRK